MLKNTLEIPVQRDALVVLGMHRSGTSALAGLLAHLGCATPTALAPADENNERGYFESIPIWRLSEDILEAAGSSWDDWAPVNFAALDVARKTRFGKRAHDLLKREFLEATRFVLKDPRICRLLPFWLRQIEAQGCTPRLVLTHRHPTAVTASLERRDRLNTKFSRLVWLRYLLEAEAQTRKRPRVFTSYDRLLSDWRGVIAQIDAVHGLDIFEQAEVSATRIETFLNRDICHFAALAPPDSDLPWLGRALEIFDRWAEQGEDAVDYDQLDGLRRALDVAWMGAGDLSRSARLPMNGNGACG